MTDKVKIDCSSLSPDDSDFLIWVRDRLVEVTGDSPKQSFIQRLEGIAVRMKVDELMMRKKSAEILIREAEERVDDLSDQIEAITAQVAYLTGDQE